MAIDKITSQFAGIPAVKDITPKAPTGATSKNPESFGDFLSGALKEVDGLQQSAENQVEGVTLKSAGVTPHSAMVALEKADIAFQLMSAVRSKIVRAYEDVMRTQV